ncbi:MAG: ABC transporter permease [Candidatus Helarchaeota archaeon]|nr:ABC transporter permease [Candidatus Helarchaeota archaeon]
MPRLKKLRTPVLIFSMLFLFCLFIQQISLFALPPHDSTPNTSTPLEASVTYEIGTIIIENQTIADNILIMKTANVTLINSTVQGSIYIFNTGILRLFQGSNVTGNVVTSDSSSTYLENSTVGGTIECRDSSLLNLTQCDTGITAIWKFDFANITISNSTLGQVNEFGIGGYIQILNSQISLILLNGLSTTYINNSSYLTLSDSALPFNTITGPLSFDFITMNFTPYSTAQRTVNLTWQGWESPIIDGFMNLTFEIYLDEQFYASINGSGFFDYFSGSLQINITETGLHNISLVSIDSSGNNYTTTISVEIIEYPTFPWFEFWIVIGIIAGIIVAAIMLLKYKQRHGYQSALGTIFKKEIGDSKIKLLIFVALGAVPGIIVFFIFNSLSGASPTSIDSIRRLVNMIFTMFLTYFGLAFSIIFGMGAVVKAKKDGSLSWFLSKPVRRWEFLWGKTISFLVIILLVVISTTISFVLGGIAFIDPIYIPDLLSMGGYVFIIGLSALIPLTAIVILCSTVFNKPGLTIVVPIILLMVVPVITMFLPILTRNELPLLFSFTYYYESLGGSWVASGGGVFGSMSSNYGILFGITITPLEITPIQIILILSCITIACLALSTFYIQRKDIP